MLFAELLLIILLVGGVVGVGIKSVAVLNKNKLIASVPPGALASSGDSRAEIKSKAEQYRLLLRSVRVLDDQLVNQDIRHFIPPEMQKEMLEIVHEFYNR